MAQIDPSIALGFKQPQIQDPVAATMRAQEVGINALKMGELQRGIETQNKLRQLFSEGVDVSTPEGFKSLAAVDPAAAMKLRNDALQGRKLQAETGTAEFKLTTGKIDQAIKDIANYPTAQDAFKDIQRRAQAGDLPKDKAEFLISQLNSMPYEKFQIMQLKNLLGAKDRITTDEQARSNKVKEGIQQSQLDLARQGQKLQYDPDLQSRIAEAKASGDFIGKNKAAAAAALPGAVEAANEGIRLIDEMVGKPEVKDKSGKVITKGTAPHPGFSDYVGGTLRPGMRFLEGSDAASFEVRQKQIEGKAFLEAFQALKGGGAITEKEGEKGTAAIMRMNKASNEKEYIAAARELQTVLRTGMERARAKAGNPAPSATPSGGGGVIDYNSLN